MAWYSASELAGLPGLPALPQSVTKKAIREGWSYRPRKGRGGGREYHFDSLPAATRIHLSVSKLNSNISSGIESSKKLRLTQSVTDGAKKLKTETGLIKANGLTESGRKRLDAKSIILHQINQLKIKSKINITRATQKYVDLYNNNEIEIEQWIKSEVPKISTASIYRWKQALNQSGLGALAGQYGNRKGQSKVELNPAIRDFIIGILVDRPHTSSANIIKVLKARHNDNVGISNSSIERWINNWKKQNTEIYTALTNPDEWKSNHMVAFGSSSENITRLNQLWELDSTPADIMLTDGRHSIIGVIDVYSRRPKLLVSKTSKATAIASTIRHALLEWGVPEVMKTDNGSDYVGKHMLRVYTGLGVEHITCDPFSPWQKPHVERFFRTFSHDMLELLDGFIGHNVAERNAIENRKAFADRLMKKNDVVEVNLDSNQLQKFCDDWVTNVYMHQQHKGLKNKTPFQMFVDWPHPINNISNERSLDILLAEAPGNDGFRTVTKKGISVDNYNYIAAELEAYTRQQVRVLLDPEEMSRIYVFGGSELDFVCIAECPELTGISRQEVAAHARNRQRERVQQKRKELKSIARKTNTQEAVNDLLQHKAQQAKKITVFPKQKDEYTSDGLNAAADAVTALDNKPEPDIITEEEFKAAKNRILKEQQKPVAPVFETPFERCHWLLEESLKRELSKEEQQYLERYRRENPRSAANLDDLLEARHGQNFRRRWKNKNG